MADYGWLAEALAMVTTLMATAGSGMTRRHSAALGSPPRVETSPSWRVFRHLRKMGPVCEFSLDRMEGASIHEDHDTAPVLTNLAR